MLFSIGTVRSDKNGGGNDDNVSEMRKRNEKRLSVQQQGRRVQLCKRSAERLGKRQKHGGICKAHGVEGRRPHQRRGLLL